MNQEIKDFYQFTVDDFRLENYVTGPKVENIPVAV
jgi:thymidylate synthase